MKDLDIDYLQAELSQAQQLGARTLQVRVTELHSLLSRIRHLSNLPEQPVKVFGFARPGEVDKIRRGKLMTIRVRRLPTEWCTHPIYVEGVNAADNCSPDHHNHL